MKGTKIKINKDEALHDYALGRAKFDLAKVRIDKTIDRLKDPERDERKLGVKVALESPLPQTSSLLSDSASQP